MTRNWPPTYFPGACCHLLRPLDLGDQAAPAGFLVLQKCEVMAFGHGELALRLVPFLASVIVLPVFFLGIRKIAGPATAMAGTAWLALAEPLVRYSSEGKQYSTDVLWTTVVLTIALSADSLPALAVLGIVGAILLWFSHPLLFVLGGIGLTLFLQHLRRGQPKLALADAAAGVFWLASFAANYLLISRHYAANDFLRTYWQQQNAFAPLPRSLADWWWYPKTIVDLFHYPLGILPSGNSRGIVFALAGWVILCTAAAMLTLGCLVMARQSKRALGFVVLTLSLTLAASAIQRYPFAERLTLFFAPLFVLPLAFAIGIEWRRGMTHSTKCFPLPWYSGGGLGWGRNADEPTNPPTLTLPRSTRGGEERACRMCHASRLLCAILFVYPVYIQAKYLIHPEVRYDAKPAILYVKSHWQAGDAIYLHWGSNVLGNYYLADQPALAVPPGDLIHGEFDPNPQTRPHSLADDLLQLRGRSRVWIVFSMGAAGDQQVIEQTLNQRGKPLDRRQFNGSETRSIRLAIKSPADRAALSYCDFPKR